MKVSIRATSGPDQVLMESRSSQVAKGGVHGLYDKVERMSDSATRSGNETVRFSWRIVCLALALFLLYNPFFTICPAAGPSTTIQNHLSYRSTIAASELGCSNLQHTEVTVEPIVAWIETVFDMVTPVEEVVARPSEETVAAPDGFASPLWSRPPPAQ